jgi:cell division protein FtsW (lipid II flippase)
MLIVCLSPGLIAAASAAAIFSAEAILISIKRPYGLGGWKRPLLNKIIAVMIGLLFVAGSITSVESTINKYAPLAVLALLFVVVLVAIIGSLMELKQNWKTQVEKMAMPDEKNAPPLPL